MDEAFIQAKQMISQEVFLTYPDWTTPFYVHTNASDKQLGTAISQNNKINCIFQSKTIKIATKLHNNREGSSLNCSMSKTISHYTIWI